MTVVYERTMPLGPVVRIRRVSRDGEQPVRAVLEVDRRAGTPRASGRGGNPPPLLAVEGESDEAVTASLLPFAEDDAAVARLMAEQGAR